MPYRDELRPGVAHAPPFPKWPMGRTPGPQTAQDSGGARDAISIPRARWSLAGQEMERRKPLSCNHVAGCGGLCCVAEDGKEHMGVRNRFDNMFDRNDNGWRATSLGRHHCRRSAAFLPASNSSRKALYYCSLGTSGVRSRLADRFSRLGVGRMLLSGPAELQGDHISHVRFRKVKSLGGACVTARSGTRAGASSHGEKD